MSIHTIYLALGSNLGDRLIHLQTAIESLAPEVRVLGESQVYETPPWGYTDQPAFLNMAVKGGTALAPRALLAHLKQIESQMGREPTFRYGPRLIDLDILLYDDLVLDEADLTIPHPALHERAFVLVPLADVAAQVVHPVLGKTIAQILKESDSREIRRFPAA